MTAVSMLIAPAAAPSDAASAARAGGGQGALFDGVLAQAGRLLDAAAEESAAAGQGDRRAHPSGADATGDGTDGPAEDEAMTGVVATAGSVMAAALGALLPSPPGQRGTAIVASGAAVSGDDTAVAPWSPAAPADARPDGAVAAAAAPSPATSSAPSAGPNATASLPDAPAAPAAPVAPAAPATSAADEPAAQTGASPAALRADASTVSGVTSSAQSAGSLPAAAAATVAQAQGVTTAGSPTTAAAASALFALAPQDGVSVRVRTAPASVPPAPTSAGAADADWGGGISPSSAAPSSPVEAPAAATGSVRQPIAAQVAPVLVSIVQRPVGTHRLTLTVNPESLGPVTVTAHVGRAGDVRVEIVGATEVGREALRAIVADLRRDLAAVMPHATLSVGSGASSGTDAAPDHGHGAPGGPAEENARGGSDAASRDRPDARQTPARALDLVPGIRTSAPAGIGEGLDTFA